MHNKYPHLGPNTIALIAQVTLKLNLHHNNEGLPTNPRDWQSVADAIAHMSQILTKDSDDATCVTCDGDEHPHNLDKDGECLSCQVEKARPE